MNPNQTKKPAKFLCDFGNDFNIVLLALLIKDIVRKYEKSLLIQIYASVVDTKLHIAPNIHIAPHSIMGSRKNYMHMLIITLTGGALQIASGKSLSLYWFSLSLF